MSGVPTTVEGAPVAKLDVSDVAVLRVDPAAVARVDGGAWSALPWEELRASSLASVISYPT